MSRPNPDGTLAVTRRRLLAGSISVVASVAGCIGGGPAANGPGPTDVATGDIPEEYVDGSSTPTRVESLDVPVRGDPDADVAVVAFEDFACPHCRTYALSVQPELDSYVEAGQVRYERHDFPLPVDRQWSWAAAGAARAVQDRVGVDAFWQYARALYEHQDEYAYDLLADLATDVGADGERVRRASELGVYQPVVAADRNRGRERGVNGTPTVFVDGTTVEPTTDELVDAVEAALE